MSTETLTQEQHDIIDAVSAGADSLIISAGPGTGKTFTNVRTMANSGYGYKLALAFNKRIADELKLKAPSGVTVQTTHAAGFGMLKSKFRSKLNSAGPWNKNSKTYRIVQKVFPNKYSDDFDTIASAFIMGQDLYGFGSTPAGDGFGIEEWHDVLGDTPLDADSRRDIAMRMAEVLTRSVAETEEITFADMLTMPLYYGLTPQFPQTRIWGDEIQDWSEVQLRLVKTLSRPSTLFYGFGDRYQSIYAFRGADIYAMDRFRDTFHAREMPLNTSFRCPQSVIELAQRRNSLLTFPEGTPEGIVDHIKHIDIKKCDQDTMIICRMNAPLISLGLKFLAQQRPVRISSNLPGTIRGVIKRMKTTDMSLFHKRLELWFDDQLDYAGDSPHLKGAATDKYNAIIALYSASKSVDEMLANLDKLTTGSSGPYLTTVHKAKGLEAKVVILLNSQHLLAPGDDYTGTRPLTDVEIEQENNIWYVAVTRAQEELYFA